MKAVIALPFAWLVIFFLLPFALVLAIALGTNAPDSAPPVQLGFSAESFRLLFTDDLYVAAWLSSLRIAATSTLATLLLGYPMAYAIARARPERRPLLLMLVVLPFWTSFLIRVYAWMGLLAENGILNQFLRWSGLAANPGTLLGTEWAVHLGIAYAYLPFMVLPLYAMLEKLDWSQERRGRPRRSSPSPCRCRCPASSRAACWCSSRRSASSSFPTCWVAPAR
jgi:putrescine transport system permease protein